MSNNKSLDYFYVTPLNPCKDQSYPCLYSERKDVFEIVFVTKGFIIRDLNCMEIQINKRELHITLPKQITSLRHPNPGEVEGYYCQFNTDFLNYINAKGSLEQEIIYISSFIHRFPVRLPLPVFDRVKFGFDNIYNLYLDENKDYQLIRSYLGSIIYEIKKILSENITDPYPSKFFIIAKQYNELLAQNIAQHQKISFYASLLKITPNHLNKVVKLTTGKTATELLNEIRILEAKVQLKSSVVAISDIAFNLGYNDASYFIKSFKKITGITPLEYRNM